MKTWLLIGVLGAILAVTAPAAGDQMGGSPDTPGAVTSEPTLDFDLKLGPRTFRLGARLLGRDGRAAGAWLNGEMRSDGFSLDGRVERDGKARNFKFNADIDEWLRGLMHRGATEL